MSNHDVDNGKIGREDSENRELYSFAFLGLIVLALLLYNMYTEYGYRQLAKDPVFAMARITNVVYVSARGGGRYHISYAYRVNGNIKMETVKYLFVPRANIDTFYDRCFLVAFSKSDNDNKQILITRDDYSKIGLPFPDSLKWVARYLK